MVILPLGPRRLLLVRPLLIGPRPQVTFEVQDLAGQGLQVFRLFQLFELEKNEIIKSEHHFLLLKIISAQYHLKYKKKFSAKKMHFFSLQNLL